MIVDVAKERVKAGINQVSRIPLQMHADIARGDNDPAKVDQLPLVLEDALEDIWRRIIQHVVFDQVNAVVQEIDHKKVRIDDGIQDEIKNFGRRSIGACPPSALHRLANRGALHVAHGNAKVAPDEYVQWRLGDLFLNDVQWLEGNEEVVRHHVDLDSAFVGAAVLDMQRMQLELRGQLI